MNHENQFDTESIRELEEAMIGHLTADDICLPSKCLTEAQYTERFDVYDDDHRVDESAKVDLPETIDIGTCTYVTGYPDRLVLSVAPISRPAGSEWGQMPGRSVAAEADYPVTEQSFKLIDGNQIELDTPDFTMTMSCPDHDGAADPQGFAFEKYKTGETSLVGFKVKLDRDSIVLKMMGASLEEKSRISLP